MRPGSYFHRRRTHTMIHIGAYLVGIILAFIVLRHLAPILTPILAAMGIAYLLDPLVERLEHRGVPRLWAVVMIMLGAAILVTAALAVLVPLVASDAQRFSKSIPELIGRASAWLRANLGLDIPEDTSTALAELSTSLKAAVMDAGRDLLPSIGAAAKGLLGFLAHLFELLLIPVFAFYFLMDWNGILARLKGLIPPRHRVEVLSITSEIDGVVSHWVRGQFTVVLVLSVLYPIALWIVGIHLAVPIGILAGLLTFIPYVGTAVGFALAALMALLGWDGPGPLIGVIVVFVLLHVLEGFILTPRLVGKRVGIGEAGALFAAIAGGELLGFVGVMLAIPLAAALAVVLRRVFRYYEKSDFFTYGVPQPEPEPEAPKEQA